MSLPGANLPEILRSAPVPVLVDFHAEWCGPCRWIEPTLEEVARSRAGELLVVKVDTDEAPQAAEAHRITSLPTVVLFSGGAEVSRSLGVEPARVRAMAGMDRQEGESERPAKATQDHSSR